MDIAVPSRFACLKIEDDDFRPGGSTIKKKPDNKQTKRFSGTAKEAWKLPSTANNTQKKGSSGSERPKSSSAKKHKKPKEEPEKHWEEWQQKDAKFVNEVFEQQMQNAILQSKLEFEQQKNVPVKSEPEHGQGKKKKGKTMTLDQFLETSSSRETTTKDESKVTGDEKDFFQEVFENAKKVITKEKVEQNRRKRQEVFEEVISLAQCQEKLEVEKAKTAILEKELEEARKEIALVKKRNTTLCSMLSQGEMKDKAEVLLELERLTIVKEELTEEVTNLHKLLEQERSNKIPQHGNQSDVHSKHSKEKIKKKKH